jgi:hypothetical protein
MSCDLLQTFDFCHFLTPYGIAQLFDPPIEEETVKRWLEGAEPVPTWAEAIFYQWSLKLAKHHHQLLVKLRSQPQETLYYIHYDAGLFPELSFEKLQPGDKAFFVSRGLYFHCYGAFHSLLGDMGLAENLVNVGMCEPEYREWLRSRKLKHLRQNLLCWAEEQHQKYGLHLIHPEYQKRMIPNPPDLSQIFDSYQQALKDYQEGEDSENSAQGETAGPSDIGIQETYAAFIHNHEDLSEPLSESFPSDEGVVSPLKARLNRGLSLFQLDVLCLYLRLKNVKERSVKFFKKLGEIEGHHTRGEEPRINPTDVLTEKMSLPRKHNIDEPDDNDQEHEARLDKINQFFEERRQEYDKRKAFFHQHPMKEVALYCNIDWSNPEEYAPPSQTLEGLKEVLITRKQEAYAYDYPEWP